MPRILVVDDDASIRDGLARALTRQGYTVSLAGSLAEARTHLGKGGHDAVLLDIRLGDGDGLELLKEVRATMPDLPVIMATAYGDSARAITAMKRGAFEYLTKPFDLPQLNATLARAVSPPPRASSPKIDEAAGALVGSSPKMLEVWKAIGRAAPSEVPVLVTGESGTGKELVARAIHEHSARKSGPFVAVNIAALPASLVESELFGHEKGAFTGANTRREGRFEAASAGTLFLDEIGDLDLALQTKLLRVLSDGTFERVGSQTPLHTDARVVAATSKPVDPRREGAVLREDLFYRLGVVRIELPPLRERKVDIAPIVEAHLARKVPRRAITGAALARLSAHDFPGNVRELLHVLDRACVMTPREVLDVGDLDLPESPSAPTPDAGDLDLRAAVAALERDYVLRALARANGNRAEAARLLGIARPQLYVKMKDLGIDPK